MLADADATLIAALDHHRAGDASAARALCASVLEREPRHPRALYLSGLFAMQAGDPAAAVSALRRAALLSPAHLGTRINLARAGLEARDFALALSAAEDGLRLADVAELHLIRGSALSALGRPDRAHRALTRAAALEPDNAAILLNLGNACADLDRLKQAEGHIRSALRLEPAMIEAWTSLGFVLTSLGRLKAGRAACERAIALNPDFAQAHWNLATAALLQGDFATGFCEYEWRKRHDRFRRDFLDLPGETWRGQPISGRDLLIHAEQGLGDTIQFSRYVPVLAGMGARVTLACDARLIRLMQAVRGVHRVVDRAAPLPTYDLWADQMSLPGLLTATPHTIPFPGGWLPARPGPGEGRAALVWAGNPLHSNDRRRSLPPAVVREVIAAGQDAGLRWASLQMGPRSGESALYGLPDAGAGCEDFADTADALGAFDLVVCVDTSIAHLAGAMGKPVFVMLPFAPDWRWMRRGTDGTPWYSSMRLFRQRRPGDWAWATGRLALALRRWIDSARPGGR